MYNRYNALNEASTYESLLYNDSYVDASFKAIYLLYI